MKYILSENTQKLNHITKSISEMIREAQEPLVKLCFSKGITRHEIADALGITISALSKKYPNLSEVEEDHGSK